MLTGLKEGKEKFISNMFEMKDFEHPHICVQISLKVMKNKKVVENRRFLNCQYGATILNS